MDTAPGTFFPLDAYISDIEQLAASGAEPLAREQAAVALLKRAAEAARKVVKAHFYASGDSTLASAALSHVTDGLVQLAYQFLTSSGAGEKVAIISVGGYGKGELAPYSDCDLLILYPEGEVPPGEFLEKLLAYLWDAGCQVSHAVRTVEETLFLAKSDLSTATALLDSRFITGNKILFSLLTEGFNRMRDEEKESFITRKLAERQVRHKKMGDSRYVLEPNVKLGKGGLRDVQTLYWLTKWIHGNAEEDIWLDNQLFTREEYSRYQHIRRFLWTVRFHLHYMAEKAEETLTIDSQPAVAERLGYRQRTHIQAVERFMKHYFLSLRAVGQLSGIFFAAIQDKYLKSEEITEEKLPPDVTLALFPYGNPVCRNGRILVEDDVVFKQHPISMLALFELAGKLGKDIHPRTLKAITRSRAAITTELRSDPEAGKRLLALLSDTLNTEALLRRVHETGVLAKMLPEFGRITGQMQFNMYHIYSVDEHILIALGILRAIEQEKMLESLPLASEVAKHMVSRRVLYVATLLHDIAKGRKGDHSALGAEIATKVAARLGLDAEEVDSVAWLVAHHLEFSDAAFRRDLSNSRTIQDFAALVQSPERLRLLYLMTVADIRAVGPSVWNGWKASLLEELYNKTKELMDGKVRYNTMLRLTSLQLKLKSILSAKWLEKDIGNYFGLMDASFWLLFDADTHVQIASMVKEATRTQAPLTIEVEDDTSRNATKVTLYTKDKPHLFVKIAYAMAKVGLSILDAKIFTMKHGMALDFFWVHEGLGTTGSTYVSAGKIDVLKAEIAALLAEDAGSFDPLPLPVAGYRENRMASFAVVTKVFINTKASPTHTVIEIDTKDRVGLLYHIAKILDTHDISLVTAHISTYGETAVDVFYVQSTKGNKIENEVKLEEVRQGLLAELR